MIDLLAHIKGIFDKYKKDEVTVYAAQASFFIVIAFFPFIMLLLTVIQLVPGGRKATQALKVILPKRYETFDEPPKKGKDYNDYLCIQLGIWKSKERNFER